MNNFIVILNSQRKYVLTKKMVIMKRVDCERGFSSFILSSLSFSQFSTIPGCRYYGVIGLTIKLSQSLSILMLAVAQL